MNRHLIHGFTTRRDGDMRQRAPRTAFFSSLSLVDEHTILCEQTHGNRVATVDTTHGGTRMPGVDALVYRQHADDTSIVLAVRVADCVPLLFIDKKTRTIAAAHAGWRGTAANIAGATIVAMEHVGSAASDIQVTIGPHIGACCYAVDEARARKFASVFGEENTVVGRKKSAYTLDIGEANRRQLIAAGVPEASIEDVGICTSCSVATFFSYRKDTKESFGEIFGFIGWSTGSTV